MKSKVLISGGTGEIGTSIVDELVKNNHEIIILTRNPPTTLSDSKIEYLKCDLNNENDLNQIIENIKHNNINIYSLIICSGVNHINKIEAYTFDQINNIVQTNLTAPIHLIKSILPFLKKNKKSNIIIISSQAGIDPQVYNLVYSAAKSGLINLTKGLAKELGIFNIAVNCICPGDIESEMMNQAIDKLEKIEDKSKSDIKDTINCNIPIGRFGEVHEISSVVKYLVECQNSYLTGSNIVIAGGRTCH